MVRQRFCNGGMPGFLRHPNLRAAKRQPRNRTYRRWGGGRRPEGREGREGRKWQCVRALDGVQSGSIYPCPTPTGNLGKRKKARRSGLPFNTRCNSPNAHAICMVPPAVKELPCRCQAPHGGFSTTCEFGGICADYSGRILLAFSPLGPVLRSNDTRWFSDRLLKPLL